MSRVPRISRRGAARTLTYLSLVVASVVVLLPLLVVLLTSLKSGKEMANDSGALELPDDPLNLDNYVTAFQDGRMLSAFGNTAFILFFSVTGTVIIGSMAAYAIDRFTFRFKGPFGAHWENISAGAVLVVLPTLAVFLFLQRRICNGFTRGATK